MKIAKDLVAASAVPLVLSILAEGDSYGYAILQRVRELSGGELAWTDGMLYPVLHRLETQGLVRARWAQSPAGRRRRYYAITAAGRRALAGQKEQWLVVQATLSKLWGVQHG
jgi:DNA-binding PadR family transcriptional regulator